MTLPAEVRKHTSAWVFEADTPPRSIRYGVDGESLVCFGDDSLATIADGARVHVCVHEIHDGPPIVRFDATLHEVAPSDVTLGLVSEIVGHRAHTESLAAIRATRRIVALTT